METRTAIESAIDGYIANKHSKVDISPEWEKNVRHQLKMFLTQVKADPTTCTTKDLQKAFAAIRRSKKYKQNYRRQLINTGKAFCRWQAKTNEQIDIGEIDEIELPCTVWKTKKPEDMLTPAEVETVIKDARHTRDKCFFAMLYDGSNRPRELLRLKWKDIVFDEHGAYFVTDAKTKKERRIRLTTISLPYLDQWRNEHPDPRPDQHVFVNINATKKAVHGITIDNVQRLITETKRRTGIKKLKASIFRPTRITHDVAAGVELQYIMKKNWGSLKTKMIDIYTNLDDEYIDETALRHAGMNRKEGMKAEKSYKIEPPVCPACQTINILGAMYCVHCRKPLTEEAKRSVNVAETVSNNELEEIMANPQKNIERLKRLKAILDSL